MVVDTTSVVADTANVVVDTAKSVWRVAKERRLSMAAASVAYYALASLAPLAIFVFAVASLLGLELFAERVITSLKPVTSEEGQRLLDELLRGAGGATGASAGIVGFLALLWGGLKLFRGLSAAFVELYAVSRDVSFLRQLRDALVVFGLLAAAVSLVVAAESLFYGVVLPPDASGPLQALSLALLIGVVFFPLYYVLPPKPVTVREALPGTVFAALGWVVLRFAFSVYAANAGRYQVYGILGAVLLFVTWLYFGALVVMFGAAVNVVLAGEV